MGNLANNFLTADGDDFFEILTSDEFKAIRKKCRRALWPNAAERAINDEVDHKYTGFNHDFFHVAVKVQKAFRNQAENDRNFCKSNSDMEKYFVATAVNFRRNRFKQALRRTILKDDMTDHDGNAIDFEDKYSEKLDKTFIDNQLRFRVFKLLRKALNLLKPMDKLIVEASFLQDHNFAEIAKMTNMKLPAVRKRKERAVKKLHKLLIPALKKIGISKWHQVSDIFGHLPQRFDRGIRPKRPDFDMKKRAKTKGEEAVQNAS